VVILTASPGIFSALMIGMGRAVGETMIVLMATGNTPVMELNIFEGMRTLAANVAVEMPESEVGGSHYRVLFLSAFVLLTFTFVMNTLAELIRQRLRNKYASL
jgi:phosphate transport system permease protein